MYASVVSVTADACAVGRRGFPTSVGWARIRHGSPSKRTRFVGRFIVGRVKSGDLTIFRFPFSPRLSAATTTIPVTRACVHADFARVSPIGGYTRYMSSTGSI